MEAAVEVFNLLKNDTPGVELNLGTSGKHIDHNIVCVSWNLVCGVKNQNTLQTN